MENPTDKRMTRKDFLKVAGLGMGGAGIATLAQPTELLGVATSSATLKKVRYGMVIDLKKCIGCRACAVACKSENHTPAGVAYNVVLEEETGEYPYVRRLFISRPCMHCERTSCVLVCPTGATYRREDGIVVIDYDTCIGCRYCITSCPYGARGFDYGENYNEKPTPYDEQPSPEYGENRGRRKGKSPIGNARKCHFCVHRVTKGLPPACSATCIGKAIHFGNLNDPQEKCMVHGEILRELLTKRNYIRLKEELGNGPSVYYLT